MPTAYFRFYGSLNDFLAPARKQATLVCAFRERTPVKDLVEAPGIPHPEIDRIVVNGACVGFAHHMKDGDRVAVSPICRIVDLGTDGTLSPPPQEYPRFVADDHLGSNDEELNAGLAECGQHLDEVAVHRRALP